MGKARRTNQNACSSFWTQTSYAAFTCVTLFSIIKKNAQFFDIAPELPPRGRGIELTKVIEGQIWDVSSTNVDIEAWIKKYHTRAINGRG